MIAHMMDQLSWEGIGERVRDSRASMGLSQQDLANRVGLERSMISGLEKGAPRIDAVELTAIARVLGYPVTHFLSQTPEVVSWSLAVARRRRASVWDGGELRRLRGRVPTEIELREAVGWKPRPDLAPIRVSPGSPSVVIAASREGECDHARPRGGDDARTDRTPRPQRGLTG